MKYTDKYKFRLPEREIEAGRDDAADINDLTFNWKNNDSILSAQSDALKNVRDEAEEHRRAFPADHPDGSITDSKIGSRFIGAFSGGLQALFSAIGLMFKAVTGKESWNDAPDISLADAKKTKEELEAHTGDAGVHVGEAERLEWNRVSQKLDGSVIVQETGSSTLHVMSQNAVSRAIASGGGMKESEYAAAGVDGAVDRALSADCLTEARVISLSGGAEGSVVFDGTGDAALDVTGLNLDYSAKGILPVEKGGTGSASGLSWELVYDKPEMFTPEEHSHFSYDIMGGTFAMSMAVPAMNRGGTTLRNIVVQNAAGNMVYTDHIIMKRK